MNQLGEIFIGKYNNSHNTQYRFECERKSMFSLPSYKIANFDFYQLAFIEGKLRHPIVNDLMVMIRRQSRLIIEVLVPTEKSDNETLNNVWTPDSKFIEHIIYPLENDALKRVTCSKYLMLDFRTIGLIKITDFEEIYKKSRMEWDKHLNNKELKKFSPAMQKELSLLGIPLKHWFDEIWLSYRNEMENVCCIQIW